MCNLNVCVYAHSIANIGIYSKMDEKRTEIMCETLSTIRFKALPKKKCSISLYMEDALHMRVYKLL